MQSVDDNSRGVGKGVYLSEGLLKALQLSVNPATHKLRIEVIPRPIGSPNIPHRMPIDDDSYNVDGALTDDSNKILTPLSVDLVGSPAPIPALRIDIL